jgi:predicted molibdopterin-dependent oxidoreductase YjgC
MFDATVTTTCGYCGVGCRLEAQGDDEAGAGECVS